MEGPLRVRSYLFRRGLTPRPAAGYGTVASQAAGGYPDRAVGHGQRAIGHGEMVR